MSALQGLVTHAKTNFSALAFYSEYEGIIRDVWTVLGRSWTNLAFELGWALENIPAGEHGKLKIELTLDQRIALQPLLSKMDFFRGLELRPGSYDEIHVTGAKFNAMVTRIRNVRRRILKGEESSRYRVEIGCWVGFFGQRPRTDWQDGTVQEIYGSLTDEVKRHPWVIAQMELQRLLDKELREIQECNREIELFHTEWKGAFATELELGILAFIVAYEGDVQVGEYEMSNEDLPKLPGVPKHTVASCPLTLLGHTPVLALNAPAVIRDKGAPRPTTVSTAEYWLKFYSPKPGAKIVVVSGKTHWYRVIGDFERLVHTAFPDVSIFGMSEAGTDSLALLNNALAELVWLMQNAHNELYTILTGRPVKL